jgi:methylmalonyl-CoA mutase N-terminal domain/subunit
VAQPLEILRISPEVEREQVKLLTARRAERDQQAVDAALAALVAAARTDEANLVPPMLDAARAEATLGEICDALRAEWGAYTEPAAF